MPSRLETREELNSDLIPIEFDFQSYLSLYWIFFPNLNHIGFWESCWTSSPCPKDASLLWKLLTRVYSLDTPCPGSFVMRRMWPGGSRPSPGRFDPTWEEIACAAGDVGGARREKKKCVFVPYVRANEVVVSQLCHTLSFTHNFHTYHLSHAPSFTHNFATHSLSHTTFTHTIFLCHTPSFTTPSLSHTFYLSILQHLLRLSFRPRPATTWKKLTCGVIRSFNSHEIWENPGDNFQKMKPVFTWPFRGSWTFWCPTQQNTKSVPKTGSLQERLSAWRPPGSSRPQPPHLLGRKWWLTIGSTPVFGYVS